MERAQFFDHLWEDFVKIAPQAAAIRAKFVEYGEPVVNDHVAFRTFNRPPIALAALEPLILSLGYQPFEDYRFVEKKLRARAYICPGAPRIFLSELLVDELSRPVQQLIDSCIAQVAIPQLSLETFSVGRLWDPVRYSDYERIATESEYAGWLCALGLRANHFTLSVNAFQRLTSIEAVLDFVERAGYAINTSGGRVKGSRALLLEQGSTLADRVRVQFAHNEREIPTCYYEFALRHPGPDGRLFEGFVETSANRIFESTDR
jgi:hypothetical protein